MGVSSTAIFQQLNDRAPVFIPVDRAEQIFRDVSPHITWSNMLLAFVSYVVVKFVVVAIYRVTFHPLAGYPGPFLAKITNLYEMYYAVFKDGQYTQHCYDVLHPKYGPMVRTNPFTVRVSDPDSFFQIHHVGSPFLKWPEFYLPFQSPHSSFGSVDPKIHRTSRSNIAPMLSKSAVKKHEHVVIEKAKDMLGRLDRFIAECGGVQGRYNGRTLYFAYLFDAFSGYGFGQQYDLLKLPVIQHRIIDALTQGAEATMFIKYFPIMMTILEKMPFWVVHKMSPAAVGQEEVRGSIRVEVDRLQAKKDAGELEKKVTVLSSLIDKGVSPKHVAEEGHTLVAAALDTNAWTLQGSSYHLAANKDVQEKLYRVLKEAAPGKDEVPTWSQLEQIPYFNAVVKECLRITHSIAGPLQRVIPEGASVLNKPLPKGYCVETDIYSIVRNPKLFPNPHKFDPERWMGPDSKGLDKYLLVFGTGTRACGGIEFAKMNLFIGLAAIFRHFEIDLTKELEEEGWQWTEKWGCVKRGALPEFLAKRRPE
ncbi:cytochrome P450 [Ascobolus immersus RN42]|uniref:Cytochrome P450 n=1 Tax=Ascobolus immersus RN42 TaxID=1160509 RepID=A0A3N4IMW0_ASCIM|nr:cytochrome P450 [Ascobolus immersus RN42]